ncbi:methyltransferase domain-containing protein [Nibribacter ruber]|uniref:Methyltransferase domain-containing protein n=1 Tax=Nibribacter ruber TaxID=2698458 RepID=A0A6P1NZ09_9BACT|nr:class I SAM-dependent methyltransferase [Nibribacter ruber]QHL86133.1 methyltransferase domain-containing protein [Nibribacter ruber]
MATTHTADPLGSAISDYWQGNHTVEVQVFTDQADEDVLPVSYLFRTLAEMPEREQLALSLCQGKVLDVGAGAGSHALALQEKGLTVTALEISAKACATMQARGVDKVVCADFFKATPQPHNTLLLLMNGIGLAGTLDNLPLFLETCKKWLAPGGHLLLESSDILYLYEEEDGSVLVDLNGDYYGELTYVMQYKKEQTAPFPWLFIDFGLLQEFAEKAGFNAELIREEEDHHYLARLSLQ